MGHVPLYWGELANKVLKFLNHHVRVVVTGKRANRGIGVGQEIPVNYFFQGENQVFKLFKKSTEKLGRCSDIKVEKMHEITSEICLFTIFFESCNCFIVLLLFPNLSKH